ncbi:MAG TPA: manganese catalase family protein [Candidatus Stercoripulliclostridium merdipullorum]|uniref:Manganese catalase family protein n=1 Tax=Candidatus Stercoripulliclostridium merdipullorum TaxID=2840952 RepID=A0A9D1NBV5_9FIRM|nr:manganese catalase family protein [Candidatus Stercoripulliclostridium merdipullorum]
METSSLLQKLDKTPFPEFETEGVNLTYAREMLDNMGGIVSEMSAVALYFYNHLITHDQQEIAEIFEVISIEEMRHLEVFGELALDLGEDPKLLGVYRHAKYWWSPSYNKYPIRLNALLRNAADGERAAIAKYTRQYESITDKGVRIALERIIEDEKRHLEIFELLYRKYVTPTQS